MVQKEFQNSKMVKIAIGNSNCCYIHTVHVDTLSTVLHAIESKCLQLNIFLCPVIIVMITADAVDVFVDFHIVFAAAAAAAAVVHATNVTMCCMYIIRAISYFGFKSSFGP